MIERRKKGTYDRLKPSGLMSLFARVIVACGPITSAKAAVAQSAREARCIFECILSGFRLIP